MKRRIWIVVTACVAAVLICAACLIGVAAHRGIGARQIHTEEFIEESEAIAIAQEYAQIDPMDDWEVSTGWNCVAGLWTVTFSDLWRDGYIEVTVRYNGEVLTCEQFE